MGAEDDIRTREETEIYDLAKEIDEDLSENYLGEEFLQKAKRIFREHGYFVYEGTEREVLGHNRDYGLEGDHVEYSAKILEYDSGPGPLNFDSTDVKFILEDGRPGIDNPSLDYENTELTDLPEKETLEVD